MKSQNGFTLVELAIALMVIGLLIGGVLKGQELIENARITAYTKQFKDYDAAIMIFRNTYGAYPGDIKRPNRIPNCTTAICNIPGNGNGKIQSDDTTPAYVEFSNFFPHLTKAGLIKGPEGGTAAEMDAALSAEYTDPVRDLFYPQMHIGYLHFDTNSYYILMSTQQFARIDTKIDDGRPLTGDMRSEDCALVTVDGIREYNITVGDYLCGGWLNTEALPRRRG